MQEIFWRADDADIRIPQTRMSLSSHAQIIESQLSGMCCFMLVRISC
jgi:hypothetical protein